MRCALITAALGLAAQVSAVATNFIPKAFDPARTNDLDKTLLTQGSFVSSHEAWFMSEVLAGIIQSQQEIQQADPALQSLFECSVNEWYKVYQAFPNWAYLEQINITPALEALREALQGLQQYNIGFSPVIKQPLTVLLEDELLLIGLLNKIFGDVVLPAYLANYPGVIIGALLHFTGIDVTNPVRQF